MRQHALLCIAFLTLLSATTVQGATPVWSLDVGPGYITTSPVVDEDRVYLRTSGFWTGEERPEVMAIDAQGRVVWTRVNSNTTQHDMAPLILVPPGTGPCGAWPEFLLVGWADGTLEALDTDDGRVLWSLSTFVDGWGITGRAAVDGDHAVVPLRNGLVRLCLSNGAIDFQSQLDLGWRNGVTVTEDGFWMGDEAGHLWHVARNGEATSPVSLPGSLRHPPVLVGDTLLLHAQTSSASRLFSFHPSNGSLVELAVLGPSPAVPLGWSNGGVFGDSSGLTSVACFEQCEVVSQVSGHVNGEMAWASSNVLHAPVNTLSGGWMTLSLDALGGLGLQAPVNTTHDGYGTAAPGYGPNRMYLGNDHGLLMAIDLAVVTAETTAATSLLPTLLTVLAFTGVAVLASRDRMVLAWRWFSLVLVALSLSVLPALSSSWTNLWPTTIDRGDTDSWDPSWPDTWLGTQVVVFTFDDTSVVVGGLVGHSTVLEATTAAANQEDMPLSLETTALGTYLVSINGTTGSGWEYFVDGQRGDVAVDLATLPSAGVLVWRLA